MNAVRWYASKNGARNLPTIRQVKLAREQVLNVAGAEPRTHEGKCGHLYTTNSLTRLIKHVSEVVLDVWNCVAYLGCRNLPIL